MTKTRILIFISQIVGFEDLLFEELEPLLEFLEVMPLVPGRKLPGLSGYSIILDGTLETAGARFGTGDILIHDEEQDLDPTVLSPTSLINFSRPSIEAFLRKEPELGMLILEHLGQNSEEDEP